MTCVQRWQIRVSAPLFVQSKLKKVAARVFMSVRR
jgi:hypothetical protein